MKHGIDVSRWQGNIQWNKVKDSGQVDFAILKAGGSDKGFYEDSFFKQNYTRCKEYGIPCGAYYFVGPKFGESIENGIADAMRFANIIEDMRFEYPIFLDIEVTPPSQKDGATLAAMAFCDALENLNYYVGIYGSDVSVFKDRLHVDDLKAYDKWVAKYSTSKPNYVTQFGMWQYTSKGIIDGIKGYVDCNKAYIDYEKVIKGAHLNGY